MKGELGRYELDWECCGSCIHYFEEDINNGCLKVTHNKKNGVFPELDDLDVSFDYNCVVIVCPWYHIKG